MSEQKIARSPADPDIDCVLAVLHRVADQASYTAFEPEARDGAMREAMMEIIEAFGFFGPDFQSSIRERLRFRSENERAASVISRATVAYRVGRRVPRNVYRGDEPLFTAATADLATETVALLNAGRSALDKALSSEPSHAR